MKVKFKTDYVLGRAKVKQGDILDVPDALRDSLIAEGVAEDVKEKGEDKQDAKT
ncbi:hypothetical protein H5T87_05525 [bacterium]|nr:hypothetical protein [bacterium]